MSRADEGAGTDSGLRGQIVRSGVAPAGGHDHTAADEDEHGANDEPRESLTAGIRQEPSTVTVTVTIAVTVIVAVIVFRQQCDRAGAGDRLAIAGDGGEHGGVGLRKSVV